MDKKDIRWIQRFENFTKAFAKFNQAMEKPDLNELERNGLIKRFEFTIELCWNLLKDYMQEQGLEFQLTPKGTFRQAQKSGLIHNAQVLIDGLDIRNLLSHDYSEEEFESAEKKIRQEVFPAIVEVKQMFLDMLGKQTELF